MVGQSDLLPMTMPTRGGDVSVKEEAPVETTKQAGSRLRRPRSIAWNGPTTTAGDYHNLAAHHTAGLGTRDNCESGIAAMGQGDDSQRRLNYRTGLIWRERYLLGTKGGG